MGTSQSSSGPGPAVPFVPPWADDPPPSEADVDEPQPRHDGDPSEAPAELAPRARFSAARRNLGSFVRTGDSHDLQRSVGLYVSQGYGGANSLTRRFSGTATTAGRLAGVLQSGNWRDGNAIRDAVLANANDVNVLMDAIVEAANPTDGTQDSEASRKAVRDALSDLLDRFPNADLLALDDSQRSFVVERYVGLDVYNRFCLDMLKVVMAKAVDPATGLSRLRQIRSFIAETVAAGFRAVRERAGSPTTVDVTRLARGALAEAFGVFEEYLT